ncbi:RING-type E3 ubiquitin transferase [Plasmodiophora brassicae]
MGRTLAMYSVASVAASAMAIAHAFVTRKQFYNAAIFLTTAKIDLLILGNLACMLMFLLGKAMLRIFFGRLRGFEVENLVENGKYSVTETCLALTTFRQDIDFVGVFLFASLLFFKCFHWLLASRVDHVSRSQDVHISEHVRLFMLILLLGVSDYVHVSLILNSMSFLSEDQSTRSAPSVHFLFAFEFSILLVSLFTLTIKYGILWYDMRSDHMWEAKPVVTFYVDLTSDLLRLFLYTSFFVIVCSYFGLPLHLIRELYATFHTLRERVVNYLRYKRLIRNLNERFPDATPEQISARSDDQCIICREEMRSGKVLPCSHLFHFNCLRTWLERSSTCPICRAAIPDLLAAEPPPAPANRPQDRARVHAPAAAPAAPIIGAAMRQEHDADVTRHAAIPSSLQQEAALSSAFDAVALDAQRRLLQQHTLSVEEQIRFHTNCLRELSTAYDQLLLLQQQMDDVHRRAQTDSNDEVAQ